MSQSGLCSGEKLPSQLNISTGKLNKPARQFAVRGALDYQCGSTHNSLPLGWLLALGVPLIRLFLKSKSQECTHLAPTTRHATVLSICLVDRCLHQASNSHDRDLAKFALARNCVDQKEEL